MEMVKSGTESHRMFLDGDLQRYLPLKGKSVVLGVIANSRGWDRKKMR